MPRSRWAPLGAAVLLVLVTVGSLATTTAQDATPAGGHGHGGHGGATPTDSPYADRYDPTVPIRALTTEQVAQIGRGEGAGFALAAELNGVPGPRHVLDLAAELGLSPAQRAGIGAVADRMRAAVLPAGQRYLAAQQALEEAFRRGTLTPADLPGRVAEVNRLRGELEAAHLAAHLETAALLTPEQIAAYQRLRGYR